MFVTKRLLRRIEYLEDELKDERLERYKLESYVHQLRTFLGIFEVYQPASVIFSRNKEKK